VGSSGLISQAFLREQLAVRKLQRESTGRRLAPFEFSRRKSFCAPLLTTPLVIRTILNRNEIGDFPIFRGVGFYPETGPGRPTVSGYGLPGWFLR
jgi:hypothetical protein